MQFKSLLKIKKLCFIFELISQVFQFVFDIQFSLLFHLAVAAYSVVLS